MKKIFCTMYFVFYVLCFVNSQNIVPNPSFEIITQCPTFLNQISFAPPWFQPVLGLGNSTINSSTSDLFNSCATGSYVGVPINGGGYQIAKSGEGYAGIVLNNGTNNYREYIEVPLLDTLITNKTYCVAFSVSLASVSQLAISNIGAYFSVDSLLTHNLMALDSVTPQIENPVGNIITDTTNWILVSSSFVAQGGEKFMTIGNFHNPANTNSQVVSGGLIEAYYYIDDVSVVDCTGVGVEELSMNSYTFKLFPNPNNGSMTLEYHIADSQNGALNIYDVTGKLISSHNFNSSNSSVVIDATQLDAGAYYYEIKIDGNKAKTDKLIIIK